MQKSKYKAFLCLFYLDKSRDAEEEDVRSTNTGQQCDNIVQFLASYTCPSHGEETRRDSHFPRRLLVLCFLMECLEKRSYISMEAVILIKQKI